MAIQRVDGWLSTPQGQALAGALVYICTQPANTATIPPSPLATVFSDSEGDAGVNPITTDGYGHWWAYLQNNQPYTFVLVHPLLAEPLVLPDQALPAGGGSTNYTPFDEVPAGDVDGTNATFTLSHAPVGGSLLLTLNGLPQTPNLNYTIAGAVITFAVPPREGFLPYAYYWY